MISFECRDSGPLGFVQAFRDGALMFTWTPRGGVQGRYDGPLFARARHEWARDALTYTQTTVLTHIIGPGGFSAGVCADGSWAYLVRGQVPEACLPAIVSRALWYTRGKGYCWHGGVLICPDGRVWSPEWAAQCPDADAEWYWTEAELRSELTAARQELASVRTALGASFDADVAEAARRQREQSEARLNTIKLQRAELGRVQHEAETRKEANGRIRDELEALQEGRAAANRVLQRTIADRESLRGELEALKSARGQAHPLLPEILEVASNRYPRESVAPHVRISRSELRPVIWTASVWRHGESRADQYCTASSLDSALEGLARACGLRID